MVVDTTQVAMTVATLKARGHNVLLTREPGGTAIGGHTGCSPMT